MATPSRTFAALAALGAALIAAIGWSAYTLLLAGAPTLAAGGGWPGVGCLLLPLAGDFAPHLASWAFMLAMLAGAAGGLRTLHRQHRQTTALLHTCLAARAPGSGALGPVARRLGLADRTDLVELAAPIAFCHGCLRPRVLVSRGLVGLLDGAELEALLLHEREHLRRRDPLKVAAGQLLSASLFFVPVVPALYRRYLVEKELAADRAAVLAQGTDRALAGALLKVLEHDQPMAAPALGASADGALDLRIDALLGEPVRVALPLSHRHLTGSALVVVLAALPLFAAPPPAAAVSSHNVVAVCHVATDGS